MRVIQAYAREPEQTRRFVESNRSLFDSHMPQRQGLHVVLRLVECVRASSPRRWSIGVGGWLVTRGDDHGRHGDRGFVLLLAQLFEPVQQLSQLYNTVQSSAAALDKLFGILDTEPDVVERQARVDLPDAVISWSTRRLPLPGTDAPVLTDVSIYGRRRRAARARRARPAPASRRWPSSWPGSTTRSRAPSRFGGVDLRDADLRSLRERIVVVPQEGFLFGGTIADNVRIAPAGATDAEVAQRARRDRRARPVRRLRARASTPRCASAARGCRPASGSWCRSPGPRWSTRPCWCSTRRRPTSTRAPR